MPDTQRTSHSKRPVNISLEISLAIDLKEKRCFVYFGIKAFIFFLFDIKNKIKKCLNLYDFTNNFHKTAKWVNKKILFNNFYIDLLLFNNYYFNPFGGYKTHHCREREQTKALSHLARKKNF